MRLEVPDGFEVTEVSSPSGWSGELRGGSVVWSGGEISEDRIAEFPFDARAPEEAGEFAWRGFVTYEGGEVVEWTGEPDSEGPAAVVAVASDGQTGDSGGEGHHGGEGAAEDGSEEGHHGSEADLPETGGMSPVLALGAAGVLVLVSAGAVRRGSRA